MQDAECRNMMGREVWLILIVLQVLGSRASYMECLTCDDGKIPSACVNGVVDLCPPKEVCFSQITYSWGRVRINQRCTEVEQCSEWDDFNPGCLMYPGNTSIIEQNCSYCCNTSLCNKHVLPAASPCGIGEFMWSDGECYLLNADELSQFNSELACEEFGGSLVAPDSSLIPEMNTQMTLLGVDRVWLPYTYHVTGGWQDQEGNPHPGNYSRPPSPGNYCLMFWLGQGITDAECGQLAASLCKREQQPATGLTSSAFSIGTTASSQASSHDQGGSSDDGSPPFSEPKDTAGYTVMMTTGDVGGVAPTPDNVTASTNGSTTSQTGGSVSPINNNTAGLTPAIKNNTAPTVGPTMTSTSQIGGWTPAVNNNTVPKVGPTVTSTSQVGGSTPAINNNTTRTEGPTVTSTSQIVGSIPAINISTVGPTVTSKNGPSPTALNGTQSTTSEWVTPLGGHDKGSHQNVSTSTLLPVQGQTVDTALPSENPETGGTRDTTESGRHPGTEDVTSSWPDAHNTQSQGVGTLHNSQLLTDPEGTTTDTTNGYEGVTDRPSTVGTTANLGSSGEHRPLTDALPKPSPLLWSVWTAWTECGATCGMTGAKQTRLRICPQPGSECPLDLVRLDADEVDFGNVANYRKIGYAFEYRPCGQAPCPAVPPPDFWTSWTDWSPCSAKCGIATHRRTRICIGQDDNGAFCSGKSSDVAMCSLPACAAVRVAPPEATYTESDSRTSAIGIGVLAIAITALEAGLILFLDTPHLLRMWNQMKGRTKQTIIKA